MMNYLQMKKKAMLNYVSGITPPLPSEYQECEYIESDGQQYIDSGVKLQFESGFEVKFYNKSRTASSNFGAIFGGGSTGTQRIYSLTSYYNSMIRWGVWGGTIAYIRQNTLQECSLRNEVFTDCNGNQTTLTKVADESQYNTYLFGNNSGGSFNFGGLGCRIYYLKFYDDTDTLIRNFIPCYHKTSGEIGMYDTVTQTFYTNAGSGSFTKGQDV